MIVKIYDDLGILAFEEPVLNDLREVLSRACDLLESDDFEGTLHVEYV
jgi:hypothetical protein